MPEAMSRGIETFLDFLRARFQPFQISREDRRGGGSYQPLHLRPQWRGC